MENKIIEVVRDIFKTDNAKVEFRLIGGMSNYTYVVSIDDLLYTVRIPGEYAEHFCDRQNEEEDIKIFERLNVTNETVYFDVTTGIKVSKYVEGKSLNEVDNRYYDKVSKLLHKIHESSELCKRDYNPFIRLDDYEASLINLGYQLPEHYHLLKNDLLRYKDYLLSQKRVLCHNDSQPSNFIIKDNGELIVVDFEFVGNNDLLYDIACFGNIEMDDAVKLLNIYFEDVDDDILIRFYLWRAFQCFQWFNVAMFKELKGMSKTLKLDFNMIAFNYLQLAEFNLNIVNKNPISLKIAK